MASSLLDKIINRQQDRKEQLPVVDTSSSRPAAPPPAADSEASDWLEDNDEGQLSVDVYQTPEYVVIKSTIAGVKPEDIDISINNDMITIRGERRQEEEIKEDDYYYQECYWGAFSRSVILPVEIKAEEVEATMSNGVLTVRLPKAHRSKSVSVRVNTN